MLFKALSFVLTIGAVLALTPLQSRIRNDQTLMDTIMMPRATDPAVQQYCFNRYIPLLKDISDTFESDYKGCQTTYDSSVTLIDSNYKNQRENAVAVSEESCLSLQKCDSIDNYADAFDCFGNTGMTQSKFLANMAGNSTLSAASIRERYATVESSRDSCFITCTNKYNKNYMDTNSEMQGCLNGSIVPEPTSNPEPTATTASSVEDKSSTEPITHPTTVE